MSGVSRSELTIRSATEADVGFLGEMTLASLFVREGERPFDRTALELPEIAHYFEGFPTEGDVGIVAALAGARCGAAWVRLLRGDNRGYGWVADDVPELVIAVVEDHRGNGIGSGMLTELLHVVGQTVRGVSLSVDPDNRASTLFGRFGFATVGGSGTSITMVRFFSAVGQNDALTCGKTGQGMVEVAVSEFMT